MSRIDVICQNGNDGGHYMRDKCSCVTPCKACQNEVSEVVDEVIVRSIDQEFQKAVDKEMLKTTTEDIVNHPKHYTSHPSGIETIELTEHMSFCLGNAIKYIMRCEYKGNKKQDLEKAIWYLQRELSNGS